MIATVVHVSKDVPDGAWGATAIYPRGVKPGVLELYSAAYYGDGAEMTGVQVTNEFGTMSGPILVVPETAVGLAYDGALSLAFERDEGLAIGSGWPPLVVGLEAATRAISATDLATLFREPGQRAPSGLESGIRYAGGGLGFGAKMVRGLSCEALVVVRDGTGGHGAQRIGVVLTEVAIGPRELRTLATRANDILIRDLGDRALTIAVSVAMPLRNDPSQGTRRALDVTPGKPSSSDSGPLANEILNVSSASALLRPAVSSAVEAAVAGATGGGRQP